MATKTQFDALDEATTVVTSYDNRAHTWRNTLSGSEDILQESSDRLEAVTFGKTHAKENGYAHSVLHKNGKSMFKMFHK